MLGFNSLAWLGLLVWVVVPFFALVMGLLLWRRSRTVLHKGLVVIASVAILSMPALVSNGVKAHYDRQVREMCAKDGGVRVYETVRLPKERFDEFGSFRIPAKQNAKAGDGYYYEWRDRNYREGNPTIRRDHSLVIRKSDGKLLGEAISYVRLGGDLPGPWEVGTSFRCPENTDITDLNKQIFAKD